MTRRDLSTRSKYVLSLDEYDDLGLTIGLTARPTHGGHDDLEFQQLFPGGTHADLLRLERAGDRFIGSASFNGITFEFVGLYEWSDAPVDLLVGLAVTSRTVDCSSGFTSVTFDQVE